MEGKVANNWYSEPFNPRDLSTDMVLEMQRSSMGDLGADCFNQCVYKPNARNLFDGMTTRDMEDWRSPSRVLEVRIHQVHYPMTEKVVRQVFERYGVVEEVCVYGGPDMVFAVVKFQSKHKAVEAFENLHGRNIYHGCCQLEIKWGLSEEATLDTSCRGTTMSSASETPVPNGPMSKGECYTVLLAELRKMREGMGVMVRRLDQCRARVDGSLGDLVSESLPEEVTACGAHAEATDDVAAVAVAYVGISVTTLPVATMDATDCDVDDELQAPAVSTIAKEAVHVPDSSAAASSANGGVPNNVDFGAIAKCSTNCLRHAAGVPTSVTMSGAAPTSGLTSPVFVVNKLSHAALIVASPLHVCLGAHPVFDGKPVSFSILPSNFSKYKSMYNQPAAHQVSEKVLDGSTVILWLLPIALEWVEQHPWLPPVALEIIRDGTDMRPMPWLSFNRMDRCSAGYYLAFQAPMATSSL